MIDIHSQYDNMHKNGMLFAYIYINNHIVTYINYLLSAWTKDYMYIVTDNIKVS